MAEAAWVPLELARVATDVAVLATETARHCDPDVRADAAAAASLAAGAARAAAHLVEVNLAVAPDDARRDELAGLLLLLEPLSP
jgi:formiminotetrahydrofolate cyclodeaminase